MNTGSSEHTNPEYYIAIHDDGWSARNNILEVRAIRVLWIYTAPAPVDLQDKNIRSIEVYENLGRTHLARNKMS
jgi:hypothetical protein